MHRLWHMRHALPGFSTRVEIMKKKVVIGTFNRHKFSEISSILSPQELDIILIFGGDVVSNPPDETGQNFLENAMLKAKYYCENSGFPSIADDSGLVIDALGGAPGVLSARFAGGGCTYADNNKKLLAELANVPVDGRQAKFVCTAVLFVPDGRHYVAVGELHGTIALSPRGTGGFGYDPIFELPDGRTVAELPSDLKNRISHRGKAFLAMREILKSEFWAKH